MSGYTSLQGWAGNSGGFPFIVKNTSTVAVTYADGATAQPGQIILHPSGSDQYAVVRFTAPTSGTYLLDTAFTSIDPRPTTTDVHVLLNGGSLFAGNIDSYEVPQPYSSALQLTAGNTVDFAVGYGNNGYFSDSTGLAATLALPSTAVPEASLFALLALGLLPVGLVAWRRKMAP